MAPSTGKSPMSTQTSSGSQKISTEILVGWPPQNAPPKVSYLLINFLNRSILTRHTQCVMSSCIVRH